MAKNTLKRVAVKYIRDGVKSNYPERIECAICKTKDDLELHHYHTVSVLFYNWIAETGHSIDTPEQIMSIRGEFYDKYWSELTEQVVCLCNFHHTRLHSVYGVNPKLHTAKKQQRWVSLQRDKLSSHPNEITTESYSTPAVNSGLWRSKPTEQELILRWRKIHEN